MGLAEQEEAEALGQILVFRAAAKGWARNLPGKIDRRANAPEVCERCLPTAEGLWPSPRVARWQPPVRDTGNGLHASDCVAVANS